MQRRRTMIRAITSGHSELSGLSNIMDIIDIINNINKIIETTHNEDIISFFN